MIFRIACAVFEDALRYEGVVKQPQSLLASGPGFGVWVAWLIGLVKLVMKVCVEDLWLSSTLLKAVAESLLDQ